MTPEALKNKKTSFLNKNIDFLLRKENIDIKNLALVTGVPAPSISRLKRVGANPTISTLEPISSYFDIDIQSLMYSDLSGAKQKVKRDNMADVPIYRLDDVSLEEPNVVEYISVSGVNKTHNLFGLQIRSESLKPVFNKGSIVVIDPNINAQEGDYVLCSVSKYDPPLFRQVFFDGKRSVFRSINPQLNDGLVDQDYSIIGVIVKAIEQFR